MEVGGAYEYNQHFEKLKLKKYKGSPYKAQIFRIYSLSHVVNSRPGRQICLAAAFERTSKKTNKCLKEQYLM